MYAVIEDSGTQFKVTSGQTLHIDRPLPGEGESLPDTVTFDKVLLVGGEGDAKIGAPYLEGATVTADVLNVHKDKKLRIVKYKRRKGSHVETGHRQKYLAVKITDIKA
ncbi:MAG: 50S ribosomal protein L21 [Planctomycetota bacterium]